MLVASSLFQSVYSVGWQRRKLIFAPTAWTATTAPGDEA
jgi:hypothetical protein